MVSIVGLSGYARSGKDTVADILVERFGFTKVSFAQPMRDALYALDPVLGHEYRPGALVLRSVSEVIDEFGWDGYKADPVYGPKIRALLQRLGTEVGRKQFGENFWSDLAVDKALRIIDDGGRVVVTDVRFVNEAEQIQYFGGEVWRVRRPNVFPANGHSSETALDDYEFDGYIDNNGSLDDLKLMVEDHFGSE